MTAGIGNPLVAAYANCYICRVNILINLPNMIQFLKELKLDWSFN